MLLNNNKIGDIELPSNTFIQSASFNTETKRIELSISKGNLMSKKRLYDITKIVTNNANKTCCLENVFNCLTNGTTPSFEIKIRK